MGVAVAPERVAVGSQSQVWLLEGRHELAANLEPPGRFDACFVARLSHVKGEIRSHELACVGRELWFDNTLFSFLCTLDPAHSFLPRWKPPFISRLTTEHRCHLNAMAEAESRVLYATALAEADTAKGCQEHKAVDGCLIDVPRGVVVARGFCMPHSPRIQDGRVWLLDSDQGRLSTVDPDSGRSETVAELPGYPPGLAFLGTYAFVGLSRLRAGRGFEGLPLASKGEGLKAGITALELTSGQVAACLAFTSGVHETFEVQGLPGDLPPVLLPRCGPVRPDRAPGLDPFLKWELGRTGPAASAGKIRVPAAVVPWDGNRTDRPRHSRGGGGCGGPSRSTALATPIACVRPAPCPSRSVDHVGDQQPQVGPHCPRRSISSKTS
jgi:uncharacterized protein (TIGR03032 family)